MGIVHKLKHKAKKHTHIPEPKAPPPVIHHVVHHITRVEPPKIEPVKKVVEEKVIKPVIEKTPEIAETVIKETNEKVIKPISEIPEIVNEKVFDPVADVFTETTKETEKKVKQIGEPENTQILIYVGVAAAIGLYLLM